MKSSPSDAPGPYERAPGSTSSPTASPLAKSPAAPSPPAAFRLFLAFAWALLVALAGGYVCGLAVQRFGELGSASLWGLGVLAGLVGRRIIVDKHRGLGAMLVFACLFAGLFAELSWLHGQPAGSESWLAAVQLLPEFAQNYTVACLLAAVFTAMGAHSAYQQTAKRYRLVRVVEV